MTMSSIQTIITDGKSGKQIDLPKTTFTIVKENKENKSNNLPQARRTIQSKTPNLKHPNEKHTAKTYSINITMLASV